MWLQRSLNTAFVRTRFLQSVCTLLSSPHPVHSMQFQETVTLPAPVDASLSSYQHQTGPASPLPGDLIFALSCPRRTAAFPYNLPNHLTARRHKASKYSYYRWPAPPRGGLIVWLPRIRMLKDLVLLPAPLFRSILESLVISSELRHRRYLNYDLSSLPHVTRLSETS